MIRQAFNGYNRHVGAGRVRNRLIGLALLLGLLAVAVASPLLAADPETETALEFITYTGKDDTGLELQLNLSGPPPRPNSFTSTSPARITLDLPQVKNNLPWSLPLPVKGGGLVKSVSTVEASGRTRVVINLDDLVSYTTRVEGNSIFVTLSDVRAPGQAVGEAQPEEPAAPAEAPAQAQAEPVLQLEEAERVEPADLVNQLTEARFFTLPGNRVQVKLTFSQSVPRPNSFTIDNPARIVLDFPETANALSWSTMDIGVGSARSMAAIEAGGRTRVVLSLDVMQGFETKTEGNALLVTLGGGRGAGRQVADLGAAPTAHHVEDIDFRRGESGEGRIVVRLSDPEVSIDTREEGGRILVDFMGTSLPEEFMQRLDVLDFATPVKFVESFVIDNNVRIVITPHGNYEHLAYQADNVFTLDIKPLTPEEVAAKEEAVYTGEKLSLNFQDIEIRAVLQLIADFTGLNMVASDTVQGSLTLRLKNVPWDQALDIILKSKGLDMRQTGNVILVAPGEEIAAREKLELEAKKQIADLVPLRTELMQVNYAKAADLALLLKGEKGASLLSERGSVRVDERTNTLLVNDTTDKLVEVRALVTKLDIPIRQVMIDSRIVIASSDFARDLGVRFGVTGVKENGNDLLMTSGTNIGTDVMVSSALSNSAATGSPFPIDVATGKFEDATTPWRESRYNVNMPLTSPHAGRIAFAILSSDTLLDLELSALQSEGRGEVVSNPRVITSNQKEALIEQGTEIPYLQASSSGATTVVFKKAVLALKVTPQITPDDRILMDLQVNKDSVGEIFFQIPSIDTKEVVTQVLVDNGETVVLGGVYEQERSKEVDKVPFLGDLPLIGALFRQTREVDDKTELLIFITPKILKESLGL